MGLRPRKMSRDNPIISDRKNKKFVVKGDTDKAIMARQLKISAKICMNNTARRLSRPKRTKR